MTKVDEHRTRSTASSSSVPDYGKTGPEAFLGRAEELELIRELLAPGGLRLLTLTGPAGVGKTRLAREVQWRFAHLFPDGVSFVDLTSVRDACGVPAALADKLGVRESGSAPLVELLSEHLSGREMLLVLDNFEQVLPAAPLLELLLEAAPGLKLLVTSRELLHLRPEQALHVLPFPVPDPARLPAVDELANVPAVALFVQRAQSVNAAFRLTEENARVVVDLVSQLDGLPLAIELAAARTKVLSPQMLLDRLEHRLSLLHWQAQDLPIRQQTLRAAIAWSYDLLSAADQALFRSLGIFVAGFTLESAEAILSREPDDGVDLLEGLTSLVDQSLVLSEGDGEGGSRFHFLESVREYALEQATSMEENEALARAFAHYFLHTAERAAPKLVGPEQRMWYLRLEQERGNFHAALRYFWDQGDVERALRLVAALGQFWEVRGYLREGQTALAHALDRAPDADPRLRATVLNRLGSILIWQEQADRARTVLEQALVLGRALDDADLIAGSLTQLARCADFLDGSEQGMREANRLLEEVLALRQELGDRRDVAYVQTLLAWMAFAREAYREMDQIARESLSSYEALGDDAGATVPIALLGVAAGKQGDAAGASTYFRRALETCSRLEDRRLLLLVSNTVLWWLVEGLGNPERLAKILGVIEELHDSVAATSGERNKMRASTIAATLETRLGTERFVAARANGRSLSFAQIIDLIGLELSEAAAGNSEAAPSPGAKLNGLSVREGEVLRLMAGGLTNKAMARRLILSENTVKTHVTSLFNKLGVDSRAQAVAVAAQRGFLDELGSESRRI